MIKNLKNLPVPTKVIFGSGSFGKLNEIVSEFEPKNVLIVTGKTTMNRLGSYLKLDKNFIVFNEVEPNPSLKTVEKGLDLCKKKKCDVVIGIGGGSPLDVGKIIAVLTNNKGSLRDYFYKRICFSKKGLPFIAVPTTAGTGSEVTSASVLTDKKKKDAISHEYIFPCVAIVDPELTMSMPRDLTAITGFDALAHGIEAYWSKKSNPKSDIYALKAIKLVYENLLKACDNPNNLRYREKMSLASLYAGVAIANAGTNVMHSVSYPLTTFYNIPHGLACALTTIEFMKFNSKSAKRKLLDIAKSTGARSIEDGIKNIENLFKKTGLVRPLRYYGVKKNDIEKIAKAGVTPRIKNNPAEVNEKDIEEILRKIW
jgi:alcohol dehydrogenase class IV